MQYKKPTKAIIFKYWKSEIAKDNEVYVVSFQTDLTLMAEDAICHFEVDTEDGKSEIEQNIFEWAVDFDNLY